MSLQPDREDVKAWPIVFVLCVVFAGMMYVQGEPYWWVPGLVGAGFLYLMVATGLR